MFAHLHSADKLNYYYSQTRIKETHWPVRKRFLLFIVSFISCPINVEGLTCIKSEEWERFLYPNVSFIRVSFIRVRLYHQKMPGNTRMTDWPLAFRFCLVHWPWAESPACSSPAPFRPSLSPAEWNAPCPRGKWDPAHTRSRNTCPEFPRKPGQKQWNCTAEKLKENTRKATSVNWDAAESLPGMAEINGGKPLNFTEIYKNRGFHGQKKHFFQFNLYK